MSFAEKLAVTSMILALLGGLFALDSKIDRQCTPPAASNIRVVV